MHVSRLTSKYQATIPRAVRERLGLSAGDRLSFEVEGETVRLARAEDEEDRAWAGLANASFAEEWLSPEDEEAFRDL